MNLLTSLKCFSRWGVALPKTSRGWTQSRIGNATVPSKRLLLECGRAQKAVCCYHNIIIDTTTTTSTTTKSSTTKVRCLTSSSSETKTTTPTASHATKPTNTTTPPPVSGEIQSATPRNSTAPADMANNMKALGNLLMGVAAIGGTCLAYQKWIAASERQKMEYDRQRKENALKAAEKQALEEDDRQNKHQEMRNNIKAARTVEQLVHIYESNAFYRSCFRRLRLSRNKYLQEHNLPAEDCNSQPVDAKDKEIAMVEAWAKEWSEALHEEEKLAKQPDESKTPPHKAEKWAKPLDEDRRTVLRLLYAVCQLCFDKKGRLQDKAGLFELGGFQHYRILKILQYCLPLDRANAIYNLGRGGIPWYAKQHEEFMMKSEFAGKLVNDFMDERFIWLYEADKRLQEEKDITKWLTPEGGQDPLNPAGK